jgi:hypothetical protein
MATTPIPVPLVNGVRHDWSSIELHIAGQIVIGRKSINYSRKRTRSMVEAGSPDPLGKTRGRNVYTADIELYLAEFNQLQDLLSQQAAAAGGINGGGYADVSFSVVVMYSENGFDQITDTILGCTLDSTEVGHGVSPDALSRKFEMNPIKILFNGKDDLIDPLLPPPGT